MRHCIVAITRFRSCSTVASERSESILFLWSEMNGLGDRPRSAGYGIRRARSTSTCWPRIRMSFPLVLYRRCPLTHQQFPVPLTRSVWLLYDSTSSAANPFLTAGPLPPRNSLHSNHPIPKTNPLLPRILQLPLRLLCKDRHPALRVRDGPADEHRGGSRRDRAQVGEEVGVREEGDSGGQGEGVECRGQFPWEDVGCYFVSFSVLLSVLTVQ